MSVRARGARDDDDQRHLGGGARRAARRAAGARASRTRRAGAGGGASASPSGARSAAGRRRARCRCRRRRRRPTRASGGRARGCPRREIHCESPARVATLPSSVIADLNSTHGRPTRACLRKGWLSSRARVASSPSATTTSTPSSRRIPRPRPEAFSVGSSEATTTRLMPACEDRVGARRRAALVAARLERHVQRRAGQVRQSPQAAIALTSACAAAEARSCQPSPSTVAVARDHRARRAGWVRPARCRCAASSIARCEVHAVGRRCRSSIVPGRG